MCSDLDPDQSLKGQGYTSIQACVRAIAYVCIDGLPSSVVIMSLETMCINPRLFRLPVKQLVFPIFPFLTSASVQFWSGSTYQSG